jgi:hypothetical protein
MTCPLLRVTLPSGSPTQKHMPRTSPKLENPPDPPPLYRIPKLGGKPSRPPVAL